MRAEIVTLFLLSKFNSKVVATGCDRIRKKTKITYEKMSHRLWRGSFGRNVKENQVFPGDNVRDSVTVIGHGSEPASGRDAVGVFGQVQFRRLAVRRLRRRQPPRLAENLLEEGRIHFQILGDDVEAKQVTIDPFAAHGVLVASLVLAARQSQQPDPILLLPIFPSIIEKDIGTDRYFLS
jgi:hypothetical protein